MTLFDEGNSVPFVARYRQEITGCLSDTQLRQLHSELDRLDKLEEKRESVVKELAKNNHLTDALRMEIDSAETMDVLDEIHQPFKTRRVSKATLAREAGMEALARRMLETAFTLREARERSQGHALDVALEHARNIIAEDMARLPDVKAIADETILARCSFYAPSVLYLERRAESWPHGDADVAHREENEERKRAGGSGSRPQSESGIGSVAEGK